ncbi:MAG: PepSY-associated TM helix domain-containing protein [Anditalea sp.]
MKKKTRKFLLQLHLYLGLIPGIPLLIVGLTGALLAFTPEIQRWDQPEFYRIEAKGKRMPQAQLVHKIKESYPNTRLNHISMFEEPEKPWTVFASGPVDGKKRFHRMHINPYNGDIQIDITNGGWAQWIESLHRNLTVGQLGRYIVGVSSALLIIISLSGLYLWIPFRKGSWRRLMDKGDALSWHNWTGIAVFPVLIVMAFTGITLTFREPVLHLVYGITASPELPPPPESTVPSISSQPISCKEAVTIFQQTFPDRIITGFSEPGNAKGAYLLHWGYEDDLNPHAWGKSYLDQYSGMVLGEINHYEHSLGAMYQQTWWMFHTGEFFGTAGRFVWALFSLTLPLLFLTGLVRWVGKNGRKNRLKMFFNRL